MLKLQQIEIAPYGVLMGEWTVLINATVKLFMVDGDSSPVMGACRLEPMVE